jgi:phage tail-like protein
MELWEWRKEVEDGKVDKARRNGTIKVYDRNNTPVAEWTFVKGWPSNLSGPSLGADSNEVAVEELTIVHEGIVRKT